MQFQPKTQEEIDQMNLWPAGIYGFEVLPQATLGQDSVHTEDTVSKVKPDGTGGNQMIKLVVNVYHPEGWPRIIMDYLLEAMPAKLRGAAYACGLGDKYETGLLEAKDFIGKSGNLKLVIQEGKLKNDGSNEKYPDKNSIASYVFDPNNLKPVSKPKTTKDELEDEIPF